MAAATRLNHGAALAIALSLLGGGSALAQDAAMPAAASPATVKPSVETTPIEALLGDPGSRAVVEATLPGIEKHPQYETFKGMTLSAVAPYSDGAITPDKLATIQAGLDRLPAAPR